MRRAERQLNLQFVSKLPLSDRERCHSAAEATPGCSIAIPAPDHSNRISTRGPLAEVATHALASRLSALMGNVVDLVITDNRCSLLHARRDPERLKLRLHHMFLDAPDSTVRALARYLKRGDRRAGKLVDAFIRANSKKIAPPPVRTSSTPQPLGATHDLGRLFDQLNHEWFEGALEVQVTWGRRTRPRRRYRQSLRLGAYVFQDRLIRIHPVLDQGWVPEFFVRYVLFHEMLHVVIPPDQHRGRTCYHTSTFRAREQQYPDYQRARQWEQDHLTALLSSQ